ncbi:MAG: hypothetical protein ACK5OC_03405, partial [Pirellula sp.]
MQNTRILSFWRILYCAFLSLFATMAPSLGQDPIRVLMLGDNGHHKPSDLYRAIREPLRQVGIELEYS